jgi:hypothetical protein
MAILSNLVGRTEADHLAHFVADLDLKVLATTHHAHISIAELTEQIQRTLRLLAEGQP